MKSLDSQIPEFFLYEFETVFCCLDFPPTFNTLSKSASLRSNSKKARYSAGMFPIEKCLQSLDQSNVKKPWTFSRFSLYVKEGVMNCRFCCVNWPTVVIVHVKNTNKNRDFYLQIIGIQNDCLKVIESYISNNLLVFQDNDFARVER